VRLRRRATHLTAATGRAAAPCQEMCSVVSGSAPTLCSCARKLPAHKVRTAVAAINPAASTSVAASDPRATESPAAAATMYRAARTASTTDTAQRMTIPTRTTVYSRTSPARSCPAVSCSIGVRPAGGSGASRRSRSRATRKNNAAAQPSHAVAADDPWARKAARRPPAAWVAKCCWMPSDATPTATQATHTTNGTMNRRGGRSRRIRRSSAATRARSPLPWCAIPWHCMCEFA
jgi:hypothetical protein